MTIRTVRDLIREWEETLNSDVEKIRAAKQWIEFSRDDCPPVDITDIEIALWALDLAINALDKKGIQ